MATRKQVNDLYLKYLGRNAEPAGLDYWTNRNLSLASIERNIARSPEAQAKVSTSITIGDIPVNLGLFTNNVTSPLQFPTDLLIDEATQGKFFQQFIDLFRPYVEGQDVDDPDRINRANEASRWLDLLGKYAEGDATEEDLKNFDAEFLSEIPAWKDYFEGIVGSTDSGTGEDAEAKTRADQLAGDLNNALGGVGNEQEISDYLYSQLAPNSPLPEGTTGPVVGIDFDCLNTRGWKDCTTLGVILQIPGIPQLPAAVLGTIFRNKTIQEIEDMIKEGVQDVKDIIQDVKDIFDPNVESQIVNKVLEKVGTVRDKIKDIFDGDGNGEVTTKDIDEVLGGVGGAILQGAYGVLINTGKSEIEKVLGLPPGTLLTSDNSSSESCYAKGFQVAEDGSTKWDCSDLELGQDRRCLDDDFARDPQNKAICGEYVPQVIEESDLFGTASFDSTVECNEGTNIKGNCICPNGEPEDENGKCPDTVVDTGDVDTEVVDTEGDPRCLNPAFAVRNPRICGGQISFTEGPTFGDGTADDDIKVTGVVTGDVDEEGDPRCLNPAFAVRNPRICGGQISFTEGPTFGDGGDEIDDECKVIDSSNYIECGYLDCFNDGTPGPFVLASLGFRACPSGDVDVDGGGGGNTFNFTVNCDQKEPYAPTGNVIAYNAAYKSYEDDFNQQCLSIGPTNGGDTTIKVKCPEGMYNPADGSSYANSEDDCKLRSDVVITGTDGGTTTTADDFCNDPFAVNSGEIGECGDCRDGYSRKPGQTKCSEDDEVIVDPEGPAGPAYTCDDPNATTNEDGSCGPCKSGFTKNAEGICFQSGNVCDNGATEESGCDTCPDGTSVLEHENGICPSVTPQPDCSNPAYAAANPQECGTGPECNDCTCAEYAAANPEECGTGPSVSSGGGGGGGGGGGAGGMFTGTVSGISYAPQALPGIQTPPPVNAMASLEGLIGRMLTGNIS